MGKTVKTEILFGINPVLEALNAGRIIFFEVYIVKKKISERLERMLALSKEKKITAYHIRCC